MIRKATLIGMVVAALMAITIPVMGTNTNEGECPEGYTKISTGFSGLSWTADADYAVVILVGGPPDPAQNQDPDGRDKTFTNVEEGDVLSREAHDISHICVLPPTLIEVSVFAVGACVPDQDGIGRALFDADGRPGATLTINGVSVGQFLFGGGALFGENTWSATALPGYVIVGPSSGTFTIEACGLVTTTTTSTTMGSTTTTEGTTTTTDPGSSTTEMTFPPPDDSTFPSTTPTTPTDPIDVLPFTGPLDVLLMSLAGVSLIGTGIRTVIKGKG